MLKVKIENQKEAPQILYCMSFFFYFCGNLYMPE